jgi:hypothetical protein
MGDAITKYTAVVPADRSTDERGILQLNPINLVSRSRPDSYKTFSLAHGRK